MTTDDIRYVRTSHGGWKEKVRIAILTDRRIIPYEGLLFGKLRENKIIVSLATTLLEKWKNKILIGKMMILKIPFMSMMMDLETRKSCWRETLQSKQKIKKLWKHKDKEGHDIKSSPLAGDITWRWYYCTFVFKCGVLVWFLKIWFIFYLL